MNLQVVVQHHPLRDHLLPTLLDLLPEGAQVVTDPDPDSAVRSPLRTYRACLQSLLPEATHLLIVQDDAAPTQAFRELVDGKVEERPNDIVCFFVPGVGAHKRAVVDAARRGLSWARLPRSWVPTVATSWPAPVASRFLAWLDDHHFDGEDPKRRGDDGPAGKFVSRDRTAVWAPVPCLVQHENREPSLIDRPVGEGNRARRAVLL